MEINYYANQKDLNYYLNNHKQTKSNENVRKIFWDIETRQFDEGVTNPSDIENEVYILTIGWIEYNTINLITYPDIETFIQKNLPYIDKTKEITIEFIGQNVNKYDNHYLLKALKELDFDVYNEPKKDDKINYKQENIPDNNTPDIYVTTSRVKSKTSLELTIHYHNTTINTVDTYPKIMQSLDSIANTMINQGLMPQDYHKLDNFDYTKYNNDKSITNTEIYANLSELELEYCYNDVIILCYLYKNFSKIFKGFNFFQRTQSLNIMQAYLKENPKLEYQLKRIWTSKELERKVHLPFSWFLSPDSKTTLYEYIKKSYSGGLNFYNDNHHIEMLHNISSVDINSSYPYAMYTMKYPKKTIAVTRSPINLMNLYDETVIGEELFLCEIDVDNFNKLINTVKSEMFRKIMVKYFYKSGETVVLTNVHVKTIKEVFKANVEVAYAMNTIIFEQCDFEGKEKIEEFYRIKQGGKSRTILDMDDILDIKETGKDNTQELTEAEILTAKLNLNGIYGIPALRATFPIFEEDEDGQFISHPNGYLNKERNILFSSFVTSYAFYNLLKPLRKLTPKEIDENFIYCDTDSLYIRNGIIDKLDIEVDKNNLGAWDLETNNLVNFYVLNHKKYCYQKEKNGKIYVRCAGLESKELDNLLEGKTDFKAFVDTYFRSGKTITSKSSILTKTGTIAIYPSIQELEAGITYQMTISKEYIEHRNKIIEDILTNYDFDNEEETIYFETTAGMVSLNEVFYNKLDEDYVDRLQDVELLINYENLAVKELKI